MLARWMGLLFLLAVLLTCACSSRGEEIVLRIADWGGAGEDTEFSRTLAAIRREFEDANPGVTIRVEHIPGSQAYVRKMLLNFIAGAEPDIMVLDASSAAVFIGNGVLRDLRPFIDADKDFALDDFFPNVVDIARRGDQVFAIPGDFTPMVVFYNRALFDRFGVPYPKAGWTLQDFRQTCQALTKEGKYGLKFANWMPAWLPLCWNFGADVLNKEGTKATGFFDGRKMVEAFSFIRNLVLKDRAAPSLSLASAQGYDPFLHGDAAMEISGHWSLVGYSNPPKDGQGRPKLRLDEIGVVELPTNLDRSVTVMYQAGFAMGKNCRHPDLAWKFIKHMTSYAVQRRYQSTGIAICARKDVARERAIDERERAFLSIVPAARPPWGSVVEGYDNVESEGQKALDAVLKNGQEPLTALKRAAFAIDRDFQRR